ncbi:MAG: HAD-IC family P-type ATPase [Candidatus Obscuribacterales bacterium]|nr:HAD-IC family P-type ATPase [Candidatus Obscuribacterales bacterium]
MSERLYKTMHRLPGRIRLHIQIIYKNPVLASKLRHLVLEQVGVQAVSSNADCASITIFYDDQLFAPLSWLDQINISQIENVKPADRSEAGHAPKKLPSMLENVRRATFNFESKLPPAVQLTLSTASLILTIVEAPVAITSIALTASLLPVFNRAMQTLLDERRVGADALDGASCLLLIRGQNFLPASAMLTLISLGEYIRDVVTGKCRQLIAHQLELTKGAAWVIRGNKRLRMPVSELKEGEQIVVYPGELISFEGRVTNGHGTVVPASPEFDFTPEAVTVNDFIHAQTLLTEGKLYATFEPGQIINPADPARDKKLKRWLQRTKLHRQALRDGYSKIGTTVALATFIGIATQSLHRAIPILFYDFITGIRIAIPTAVLSSMYRAGCEGIVVRNAAALERLSEVDAIIFARSGALTSMMPAVTEVFTFDQFSVEDVTRYAAAVEQRYDHIAAYALYTYAKLNTIPVPERTSSKLISGFGVKGVVEGRDITVGSTRMMDNEGINISHAAKILEMCTTRGDSRICVAINGKLAGIIAYQDVIRKDTALAIETLRKIGIKEIAMTTGSSPASANNLARQVGITEIFANASPEDKADLVRRLQKRGLKVAVVGFDMNDTAALEQAHVAITLNTGGDIAKHRADIILTTENLNDIVDGIIIARHGMSLARQNLKMVSIPNLIGISLSSLNYTTELTAALINNGSVIAGALNGLRPMLSQSAQNTEAMERSQS